MASARPEAQWTVQAPLCHCGPVRMRHLRQVWRRLYSVVEVGDRGGKGLPRPPLVANPAPPPLQPSPSLGLTVVVGPGAG